MPTDDEPDPAGTRPAGSVVLHGVLGPLAGGRPGLQQALICPLQSGPD